MWSWLIGKVAGMAFGSSSLWKWVGIGVGAVAIAFFVLWLLWTKAEIKADLAQAEQNLAAMTTAYESNLAALQDLQNISKAKDKALAEREQAIQDINADRERIRRRWQEAIRNDKAVRDWADTPLPDAVRGMFQ